MRIVSWMLIGISLLALLACEDATPPGPTGPWQVTVSCDPLDAQAPTARSGNGFIMPIEFDVKNVTDQPQAFGYPSCSYHDSWTLDTTDCELEAQSCRRNVLERVVVEPGKSFVGHISVKLDKKTVGLRVGFQSFTAPDGTLGPNQQIVQLGPYWSNRITVTLPD